MVLMPTLIPGQVYREEDVGDYIALQGDGGRNDYYHATVMFPRKGVRKDVRNLQMFVANKGRAIVMEYQEFPFIRFETWLAGARENRQSIRDRERIQAIQRLLEGGGVAFPIWLEKHQENYDPPAVREGTHRLIAFAELNMPLIPVFLLRYSD